MITALVCDIDGTLSDDGHRRHLVEDKPKNFKRYFELQDLDIVIAETVAALTEVQRRTGARIFFLTGRPETYSKVTERWLGEQTFPFKWEGCIHRAADDYRPGAVFKFGQLRHMCGDGSIIKSQTLIWDNDTEIVQYLLDRGWDIELCGYPQQHGKSERYPPTASRKSPVVPATILPSPQVGSDLGRD